MLCKRLKELLESPQGVSVEEALPLFDFTASSEELIEMAKKALVRQALYGAGGWSVDIEGQSSRKAYKAESKMTVAELEQVKDFQHARKNKAEKKEGSLALMIEDIRRKWKESPQHRMFIKHDETALKKAESEGLNQQAAQG